MRTAYYLPHPYSETENDGHRARVETVTAVLGDLSPVWTPEMIGDPDLLIVDTNPLGFRLELRSKLLELHGNGTKLVFVGRTIDHGFETIPDLYDLVVAPAYEDVPGERIGPLVKLSAERDIDLPTLVISSERTWRLDWWKSAIRAANAPYLTTNPVQDIGGHLRGRGSDLVARADVVVTSSSMAMYEALWSGCAVVAKAFTPAEQRRLAKTIAGGESVVSVESPNEVADAIEAVREMPRLGRRPTGAAEFAEMVKALL
jgi:hypothetical protein